MNPLKTVRKNGMTFLALIVIGIVAQGCRGSRPFQRLAQTRAERPLGQSERQLAQENQPSAAVPKTLPGIDPPGIAPPRQRLAGTNQSAVASQNLAAQTKDAANRSENLASGSNNRTSTAAVKATLAANKTVAAKPPAENQLANREPVRHPRIRKRASSPAENVAKTATTNQEIHHTPPQTNRDDEGELIKALADYPPDVRREALRRLLASSARRAKRTNLPDAYAEAIEEEIENIDQYPEFAEVSRVSDLVASDAPAQVSEPPVVVEPVITVQPLSAPPANLMAQQSEPKAPLANAASDNTVASSPPTSPAAEESSAASPLTPTVVESLADTANTISKETTTPTNPALTNGTMVQPVSAATPVGVQEPVVAQAASTAEVTDADEMAETNQSAIDPATLAHEELFAALLKKLSAAPAEETDSERASRMMKLRHLMVLSGDVDSAVEGIDGLSEAEQEFVRHQLLGLWTMVDPKGHPIASRRITTALPQLRKATKFAAAATDSLEVRALAFCTEIEAYGQVKRFPKNRFQPGQQVILYCEVENFTATSVDGGFETHLQGSFDIFNGEQEKVISQLLPADRQVSNNYLRDYFIAYQMHLPKQLAAGKYSMRLTMEDVSGKKYGQSTIDFEIVP